MRNRFLLSTLCTLALPLATFGFGPITMTAEDTLSSAERIFSESIYAPYAAYDVAVSFTKSGERVHSTWETHEDIAHATVLARIFSREEIAQPTVPHGINVGVPFFGDLNPVKHRNPMGEVAFAVDQTFGLGPSRSYMVAGDVSDYYDRSFALKVIGRVAARTRRYDVVLLDTDTRDGETTLHLGLTPLRESAKNRLRELWIDGATFVTKSAVVKGIGNRAPTTQVLWRVDFRQEDGATYIQRETALEPLDYGGQGTLRDVTIAFENLVLSSSYPFKTSFGVSTKVDPLADP